jgi:hypothetical protein
VQSQRQMLAWEEMGSLAGSCSHLQKGSSGALHSIPPPTNSLVSYQWGSSSLKTKTKGKMVDQLFCYFHVSYAFALLTCGYLSGINHP